MASSEDKNFKRSLHCTCSRGKILHTISSAAASPDSHPYPHPDEGLEGETFVERNVEKRGLLNIDLNVAPPEDGDSESPAANNGGNGGGIRSTVVADVASNVSKNKVGSVNEHDLNFNGNCENQNGTQAHWSKGEDNGFCVVEDEEKQMKTTNNITDSEGEMEEKGRRNRGWNTLLEVAENALREHEENQRNKEEKFQNRKRKPSREVELGSELNKGTTRKKITGHRRQNFAAEWNDEAEVAATVLATPVVVRSTRGRAVAMPNKYRDSILDAVVVAEAEFPRHNKSGKSATVVSTKRKSR